MATPTSLPATFVAGNVLTAAQMNNLRGAFRILQVVSTTKTDTYSESLASGAVSASNITGLTASITPASSSNKVLIFVQITGGSSGDQIVAGQIFRDSTAIAIGDAASNRTSLSAFQHGDFQMSNISMSFLDSPATTSAITYGFRIFNGGAVTRTMYVNRGGTDSDLSYYGRSASTITVMEVSA